MGAYSQLKLVLWKNITLRLRQPVLLCLELFWPITIFLLVLALRKVVPPTTQEACYYNARALPSAGALPVLQSLICNVDNDCLNRSSFEDIPSYPGSKITKLVDNLSPLVHDQQILSVVKALPVLAKVLRPIQAVLNDENIVKLLEHGFPLREILRNVSEAQDVLVRHARMSPGDSEAFLMSDLNVPAILNELQHGGIAKLSCNEKTLRKFVYFKNDSVVFNVTRSLCRLAPDEVEEVLQKFQSNVQYDRLIGVVGDVMSKVGRPGIGDAIHGVADMVKAALHIISVIPGVPELAATAEQLQLTIKSAANIIFDFSIFKEIWSDFGALVPAEHKAIPNRVLGWLSGASSFPGNNKKDDDARNIGDGTQVEDVAKALNATIDFVTSVQTGRQALKDIGNALRSFENLAHINGQSTIAETVAIVQEVINASVNSSKDIMKAQRILFYTSRFFGIAVDLLKRDIAASKQTNVYPFFPVVIESMASTLGNIKRVNLILSSSGLLNVVCNMNRFTSTFDTGSNVSMSVLQNYTCHLFKNIFPSLFRTVQGLPSGGGVKSWDPMDQNINGVVATIEDFIAVSQPNYNWSKLSETMDSVFKAWTSFEETKRISHAAKLLQIASTYITPQRPKYWNDVQAVFYVADQAARLLNQQMEQILRKGQVLVSHLGLDIPSLTSVIRNILNFVPDAINIALEVVKTELGPVIEKLTDRNLKDVYVPCKKGLIADFLSAQKRQSLIDFEKNLCRSIPAVTAEFLLQPHLAAIMTVLQVVNSGQAVSFNWISAGSNLIKLTENANRLRTFNGAVFPDVPALSSPALDEAFNNVKAALGLPGSSHSSVLLQGFQVVGHVFDELDKNLNDSLSTYLLNIEPFITHTKEALSLSNGSHVKTIEELFASEPDVVPLVRWVETYLMKFAHLILHTIMHDPVKMAIFNNSADVLNVACNRSVDDYLLLSPDNFNIARSGIKHLCAINMSAVTKWVQERKDSTSARKDSETFFTSVADVISSMYGIEDIPPFANISVWRQFIDECLGHDLNDKRANLELLAKGTAALMNKECFSSLYNALHLTACNVKYSLRNLKWDSLMEAWSKQPNVIAILKVINGSADILNAMIDTIYEPDLIKTIVLEIAIDPNGLRKFCSVEVPKWNKYFALKDEEISLFAQHVRHLVCDFNYKTLIQELKSTCLSMPMLPRDATSSQLVDDTMTVLDQIDHAFPSNTNIIPPFLDAKYWKDTVVAFWNLLKNGLVKMDLTELDSWLSLLDHQISSKKSREEFSLAVQAARTVTSGMLRGFKDSSELPLEKALAKLPRTLSLLKTWVPMLPLATTSLMASLIIQYKKKEMSPLENLLRTQGMICQNSNMTLCSNPEESLFRGALCEVDFSGIAAELISLVNSDGISDVTIVDIREVIKTLYNTFGKVTMDPQLLTRTEAGSQHASKLTPFERFMFLKKLQGVQRLSNEAQSIAALQHWRSHVETTDVKNTWKKLNTFANEVMRTYELQHDKDKLVEDVRRFFSASQEHHEEIDAKDQSTFLKYLDCEETHTNDTAPGNVLLFLKKASEISEDIGNGLSDRTAQHIGLYAKMHTTKAIERFITYHANRPAHSAVRLFLSSLWMIHTKANSIVAWNAVAPALLDMISGINRHIELLPPQDAYFVDTTKWSKESHGNTPSSSLQVLAKRQTMLKNTLDGIISRWYNDQATPTEIMKNVADILDVINEYLCPDNHISSMQQSIYAATVTLVRNFPDPEELLCELPQSTLGDAYKWISDRMNIRGYVEKVTQIKAGKISGQECTTVSKLLAEVARVTHSYLQAITSRKGQELLSPCIDRILNGPLYDSIKRNLAFGSHVLKLGKEVLLQNVRSTNTSLLSYLIDKITSQLPVYGTLHQVMLKEPLRDALGESSANSSSLDWILHYGINLNTMALHNFSTDSLRSILCKLKNDTKAQAHRGIEHLCDMNLENATIPREALEKLKKHIVEVQKNSFYSGSWLYDIINNWQLLKIYFGELLSSSKQLSSILSTSRGSSWDIILSVFKLFDGESVRRMAESLDGILHVLDPIFSGGTLVDTIQGIVNGLKGLDVLEKAGMFDVKYDLEALLINRTQAVMILNRTERDASHTNAVMQDITVDLSKVRTKEGSHSQNLNELLCSAEDNGQVLGNTTHREILQEIQDASCSRDNAIFVSTPLSELIVGKILKNIGNIAFDGVLKSSGLARSGVSSALDNLSAAPKIVPLIRENFSLLGTTLDAKTSNALANLNISHDGVRVLATPAALQLVGTLICGKPLKAVQEEFKLLEVSPKEPTLDKKETEELPSEFCRHGYEQIMHMTGGPIIWGFLKPILRGQLLYTPNTVNAHTVMHELNKTFDSMSVIIDALYTWGQGTSGLKFLIEEDGVLTKLKNLVASEELQEVAEKMLGKDMQQFLGQLNVDDIRRELGGLKGLLDFVQLVGNISQCFELNRFRGYDTEDALEAAAIHLSHRRQFISAVVFTNLDDAKPSGSPLPPHVRYKIRMDIDNVPYTHAIRDRFWRPGPRADFLDDMRYLRGFAHFQQLIDQAILAVQTSNEITQFPPTYVQQFPYPCYEKDAVGYYIKAMLPLVFTLAWILLVAFFIRERVLPRELHLEEIMHVMGLRPWVDWTAWFTIAAFISFAIVFCNTVILTTGRILPHSDPLLIFIFFGAFALSVLMYCNMISTLFCTATIASLTGTLGFLVSFLPFVIAVSMEANLKLAGKLLICLFMSSSFSYGCLYVTRFEEQGLGIQWDLLWSSPIPNDDMNLGYCVATMLIDSLIYLALACYIQRQKRGSSRRPWYFIFWPSSWSRPKPAHDGNSISNANNYTGNLPKGEEIGPHDFGIAIRNLHVAYQLGKSNERVAVSGLTLDFNEGQISTLLGQNGAGKTTTLNVLTGQHQPSSGHVFVYGKNVMDSSNHIREFLGYCPQYNTLFGKLTVREHLIFFAKLKGQLSADEARGDVEIMLNQMGLRHVEDLQACRLSGGLQRRLCVGLSFIGGSKLVILDEPTSSVDPVARRNIWDLILKCKEGRTILLTTHHMDEADILSDKVAIIHRGRLLCSGSPLILKAKFGCGYQLSLARSSNEPLGDNDSGHASAHSAEDDLTNIKGLLKLIRSIVPLAMLVEEHGSEVIISLPQRDPEGNMYSFSELIALLDDNMLEYGFSNYGLSSTTLEEVFLSLCTMCDAGRDISSVQTAQQFSKAVLLKALGHGNAGPGSALDDESEQWATKNSFTLIPLEGSSLKMQQLKALLQKRLYHTISDWKAIFFSIVMPCLFIALAMGFTLIVPAATPEPPLKLTTDLYSPGTVAFISASSPRGSSPSLLSEARSIISESSYEANFWLIENVDFHSNSKEKLYQTGQCNYAYSSSVLPRSSFETLSSDVLYNISGVSVADYLINTYPEFTERRYGGWSFDEMYAKVWFENTGYHSLPVYQSALSNAFLKSAIRQSNSSVPYSTVGITVYNHPLHLTSEQLGKQTIINHIAEVGIAIVILMGLAFIPSRVTVYIVNERARDEKQVQHVSGVGPALYWTAAFIWDMGLVLCTLLLSCIILIVFGLPVYTSRLNLPAVLLLVLGFGWGTTPLMYILSRLFKEASISFMVLYCVNLFIGFNIAIIMLVLSLMNLDTESHYIFGITQKIALVFPQYSLIAGLVDLAKNEIQSEVYAMFGQDTYESPFSKHLLAYNYLAMFLAGIGFFCLNLFIEYINKGHGFKRQDGPPVTDEDNDVCAERIRVSSDAGKNDVLKIVDLVKVYHGHHHALNHVSFGIPKGECFGLLGVNGAGKTTLFRILTGQLHPTNGSASIQDTSLKKVYKKNIQSLGYCPQADALDDLLTARQHLVIYTEMRGIQKNEIQPVVDSMLAKFHLTMHAQHRVKTLSRGNKRKLCAAISMIGNPQIVLLDEPTSGMDPVTRRLVWNNISKAIKNKQSVLLTSHSMAECDILCSRLAIMVNGRLCCIGSPQYLKHRYGAGYTVTIRLSEAAVEWEKAVMWIQASFPRVVLKGRHCNVIEFNVPSREVSLYSIFKFLETDGVKMGVTDFLVSQTTLDQVFVNFARLQTEDELPYQAEESLCPSVDNENPPWERPQDILVTPSLERAKEAESGDCDSVLTKL